ncbi:TIGR00730 family Rossman fold protein [Alkanindiges sp. WGS2144]|uniref:LOG family protein n=1 Tax=Alkanindiges sp. WGS2144 TaxID=3366808 RepID=UPI0037509306
MNHRVNQPNPVTEKLWSLENKPASSATVQHVKTTLPLVALYCGSRSGNQPVYQTQAIELARQLAQHQLGIVYGGASIGLMGQVADTVIAHGGEVVGVIPDFLLRHEIAHDALTELYIVDTMHERKAIMADRASAFVALPGGLGTFEEILEVATWGQLQQHSKPIVLFNINNYYQFLIAQLDHAVQEGFLSAHHRKQVLVCQTVDEVLIALAQISHEETQPLTQEKI